MLVKGTFNFYSQDYIMQRVPVLSSENKPLMPTKASRASRMVNKNLATPHWNDLGVYYIKLTKQPSNTITQDIAVGIDPGRLYSGIGVQSSKFTLCAFHLELPLPLIKERMESRKMLRRSRRSRRFNRKIIFRLRNHRQKRCDNRRKSKLPPSIKANRQLELRVVNELNKIFPITEIIYEYVKAKGSKSFSPVMVGQKWAVKQFNLIALTTTKFGWETSNIRNLLGLIKEKENKGLRCIETHAVDGIALACSHFIKYETDYNSGMRWNGFVKVTRSLFKVIKRLQINRRSLHKVKFNEKGVRTRYGGTVIGYGLRKGDLIRSPKGLGYVSGHCKNIISISNVTWKRIYKIINTKLVLIKRNTGLLVY